MPYTMRKQGNQYCVVKESGSTVPGGCHRTQKEAQEHMRALQANVGDADDKKSKGRKVKKAVKDHRSTSGVQPDGTKKTDYVWKGR